MHIEYHFHLFIFYVHDCMFTPLKRVATLLQIYFKRYKTMLLLY